MRSKKAAGEWGVFDLNARQPDPDKPGKILPRVHEPIAGNIYPLTFNEPCWMPQAHARVFLKDPGFKVIDNDENVVPPLAAEALKRTMPELLPVNMVVADLHELTSEALLTRAAQMAGGHALTSETRREVLIRFLLDGQQEAGGHAALETRVGRAAAPTSDAPDAGEIEDIEEGDPAVSRMLEGA